MRLISLRFILSMAFIFTCTSALAKELPRDFSGIKLDQSIADTVKFFHEKGYVVFKGSTVSTAQGVKEVTDDESTKILFSSLQDKGACITDGGKDSPKVIIACTRGPKGNKELISTYDVRHFIDGKKPESALVYSFRINFNSNKEIGTGLLGKFGPDFRLIPTKCETLMAKFEPRPPDYKNCFSVLWTDNKITVAAQGYGDGLKGGLVTILEVVDDGVAKKLKSLPSADAKETSKKLGF